MGKRVCSWFAAGVALAGCGAAPANGSSSDSSAQPRAAPPIPAGTAYVATNEELLAIGPDGTTSLIADVITRDVQITSDGSAYVVTADSIGKVEGGRLVQVAPLPEQTFHHIVIQSDKSMWAVHPSALQRFDGQAWSVHAANNLISGMQLTINDVAIDSEGGMWLATRDNGLFRNNGRGWTKSLLSAARDPLTLLPSRDGGIWLGAREAVQHVTESSVDTVRKYENSQARVAAIDITSEGGWAFVATENVQGKVVIRATWGSSREQTRELDLSEETWPLVAMEVDQQGRLWAATSKSITIVPPKGPASTIALGEATNGDLIATIAVVQGGPRSTPAQLARPGNGSAPAALSALPGPSSKLDPTAAALEVVKGLQPTFKLCHTDPNMLGRVNVTAQIDAGGNVVSALASESKGLNPPVVECLVNVVKGAKFVPPGGGGTTIVIPIALIPSK